MEKLNMLCSHGKIIKISQLHPSPGSSREIHLNLRNSVHVRARILRYVILFYKIPQYRFYCCFVSERPLNCATTQGMHAQFKI